MRALMIWPLLVVAFASAQHVDDHNEWDEEEPEVYLEEESADVHERTRRDVEYERYEEQNEYDPYEEHIRVKRRCEDEPVYRVKRSNYMRNPRQVHQYEVHEFTDDGYPSSPPYEEMLAASAEHYHRVYASPGSPATARYLQPDVSGVPIPVVYRQPVSSSQPATNPSYTHVSPVNVVPVPLNVHGPVSVLPAPAHLKLPPVPNHSAYQQPAVQAQVSHPLPLQPSVSHQSSSYASEPHKVFQASVPVTVPQTLQQIVAAGDDQSAAGGHHHVHHQKHASHGHSAGGGRKHQQQDHKQHGHKTTKGFAHDSHVDKGGKGHKTNELHKKEYDEAQGKTKKHRDHADHKGRHEEEAHGHKGAKFDEKKGHKKGHKTKGYHNKYHKDEFHKEHKFYDDFHKSGEHHRFGKFNAKHASNESGKKKAHHVNAGHDSVERGKKGFSNKGHLDSDHKGHKAKHGHEEHRQHHEQHQKKGGSEGGKKWGYEKKH